MPSEKQIEGYLDTVKRIEPGIHMLDRDASLASIAISLKRIADVACWLKDKAEIDQTDWEKRHGLADLGK